MSTDPKQNVGTQVKALPLDQNDRALAGMLVPIVDAGKIVGYLPVKGIDNGDGTATLDTSTNITLDADVDIGDIHLLNIANSKIDPATEQKQDSIITQLTTLNAVDFATETTLATRASETTLAAAAASLVAIDTDLDVALSTRASETTLITVAKEATLALVKTVLDGIKTAVDAINATLDVALSTRASEATLATVKTAIDAGVAEHKNGSATGTPATVTFSGTSKSLLIENRDATNNLLVSFDGGANTKTIGPNQVLSIEANHASVDVSSSAGTVAYEMLVTV